MKSACGKQKGVALLVVLWACTLLAILLGGYASQVHIESEQARYAIAIQKSRYAAEAGVMRAIHDVYAQRKADRDSKTDEPSGRWIGDGRLFRFPVGDSRVDVRVEDESGKIDLNTADTKTLASLFHAAGADSRRAIDIADEVDVWRTHHPLPDEAAIGRYRSAGRSYVPRGAPFPSVEELQSVLGMDIQLFERVQPAVTLWSGRPAPVMFFAPPLVLATLPDMTQEKANAYIEQREQLPEGSPLALPGLLSGGWQAPSSTVTIESKGQSTDAISTTLRVTVSFNLVNPRRHPYTVLRWREMPR